MSAIKRLYEAKANLLKRQKATQMIRQGIGLGGTLATFAGTQDDKAKTAWEEYEKGIPSLESETERIAKIKSGYEDFTTSEAERKKKEALH